MMTMIDWISQLSDDILVDILSLLSLEEAGRTSVLSPRWKNLWKHTHSLDFDGGQSQTPFRAKLGDSSGKENSLEEVKKQNKLFKSQQDKYMKWVNSVIQSHQSPTLKLFRVRYALDAASHSDSITRWLEFAISKQVQRLELDFHNHKHWYDYYRFPEKLFAPSSTVFDFKSLKELSLQNVNVSGGVIEFFLRNCPLLQQLIVRRPGKIPKLEVCGSSLVLKHLEILYCRGLESLKISAPALTSLRVTSLEGILLENVPMLVDVSVTSEYYGVCVKDFLSVMSCFISRLECLNLSLLWCRDRREMDEICNFPEMPKLKKLVIEYGRSADEFILVQIASLTRASPYLEEFDLENKWFRASVESRQIDNEDASIRFQHEHIKLFKFCGYQGRPCDVATVRYILKNCVALEKIIIDPSSAYFLNRFCHSDVEEAARKNAKQHLQPQLPHHIELVVL